MEASNENTHLLSPQHRPTPSRLHFSESAPTFIGWSPQSSYSSFYSGENYLGHSRLRPRLLRQRIPRFRNVHPPPLRGAIVPPSMVVRIRKPVVDDPLKEYRTPPGYQQLLDQVANDSTAEIVRLYPTNVGEELDECEECNQILANAEVNSNVRTFCEECFQRRCRHQCGLYRQRFYGAIDRARNENNNGIEGQHSNISIIPDHLIPPEMFRIHYPYEPKACEDGLQSSIVTISSIWNTMMGTSVLATPWAIMMSGLFMGPFISIGVAFIACYTAVLIININKRQSILAKRDIPEFAQLCGFLLGRRFEIICSFFSLMAVGGAAMVYWILISNFLHSWATAISQYVTTENVNVSVSGVICPSVNITGFNASSFLYDFDKNVRINEENTHSNYSNIFLSSQMAAIYIFPILFGLMSISKISILMKLNFLGTISVFSLIGVVIYKSFLWGINVDLENSSASSYTPMYKGTFPCLSGLLALGLFIHNACITILRTNRNQNNNQRDLTIAFCFVTATYVSIGLLFYITFPLAKDCIQDNFLNNFHASDPIFMVLRAMLLIQMSCLYPIIAFILRNQFFFLIVGHLPDLTSCRGRIQNVSLNMALAFVCAFMAIVCPNIGGVIRFTGSACGFVLIFLLPNWCKVVELKMTNITSAWPSKYRLLFHALIVLVGLVNLLAQFFI